MIATHRNAFSEGCLYLNNYVQEAVFPNLTFRCPEHVSLNSSHQLKSQTAILYHHGIVPLSLLLCYKTELSVNHRIPAIVITLEKDVLNNKHGNIRFVNLREYDNGIL